MVTNLNFFESLGIFGMDTVEGVLFGATWIFIFGFIFILCLIIVVINFIAKYKLFKKFGVEGWKAFIPVYSNWVLCECVGVNPWWVIISWGASLFASVPVLNIVSVAANIYYRIILYISLSRGFGLGDGFGAFTCFFPSIGCLILGFNKDKFLGKKPINDPVMKFFTGDKSDNSKNSTNVNNENSNVSKEEKPTEPEKEEKSIEPKKENKTTESGNKEKASESKKEEKSAESKSSKKEDSKNANDSKKYCPECGTKLEKDSKFCYNCGYKL